MTVTGIVVRSVNAGKIDIAEIYYWYVRDIAIHTSTEISIDSFVAVILCLIPVFCWGGCL